MTPYTIIITQFPNYRHHHLFLPLTLSPSHPPLILHSPSTHSSSPSSVQSIFNLNYPQPITTPRQSLHPPSPRSPLQTTIIINNSPITNCQWTPTPSHHHHQQTTPHHRPSSAGPSGFCSSVSHGASRRRLCGALRWSCSGSGKMRMSASVSGRMR